MLPIYFGINAKSRENLIEKHTTDTAKLLYDDFHNKLILICDGTYATHQKSQNHEYQRKSYSGQKKKPLCKPFTVCTSSGYVIDMFGPYEANLNDASILKMLMGTNELSKMLNPGDVFVLDRGFRDVQNYLETKGYVVLMPALKGNRKQLSTKECNESRFVTKLRWIVEWVHGVIKQKNRLLDHTFDNKMLHAIGTLYKIAAFLLNQFGKPVTVNSELSLKIIDRMKSLKDTENTLAIEVEEKGWLRKKIVFQCLNSHDLSDFPQLDETQLKLLFTGSYQYSQAIAYLAEILDADDTLNIDFVKDQSNILKLHVRSRHITRKSYKCFIEYIPQRNDCDGITRYFCECPNGRRTVGCCSHLAAAIYYLSFGRYQSRIPRPAEKLSQLFIKDNITVTIEEDSDND